MKPHGAIPHWFDADRMAAVVEATAETPALVYDVSIIRDKVGALRRALPPGVDIHYALKANPFAEVLSAIVEIIDGIDVASGGELALAVQAGSTRISFAGPGKRNDELESAIRAGATINVESGGELKRALAIADTIGIVPRCAVRVNPDFTLKGSGMRMGGGPAAFGIDAEAVVPVVREILASGAEWRGFHIFAGSQALDTAAIIETQRATVALAADLAREIGVPPPLVNLGGGFGIPYFAGEQPIDIEAIGQALAQTLAARAAILSETKFAIELGRWLVGECGVYLTRVVDRKVSRGETFLVTDGGLHHQLAATGNFGTVVRRNYPVAVAARIDHAASETVTVVGCLCTPLDKLADQVALPRCDVGDVVALFMAGAYGASASPSRFLGHGPAHEIVIGN